MPFTKKLYRSIFICGLLLSVAALFSTVRRLSVTATASGTAQELMAGDGTFGDGFGYSVAVSGDTAVIGAYARQRRRGAAYVFVRSGAGWAEEATLTASDSEENDYFGLSVAISGDTIVVGSRSADQGAAYVFVRNGGAWEEQQKLTASDATAQAFFGGSVSVSGAIILDRTGRCRCLAEVGRPLVRAAKLGWSDARDATRPGRRSTCNRRATPVSFGHAKPPRQGFHSDQNPRLRHIPH